MVICLYPPDLILTNNSHMVRYMLVSSGSYSDKQQSHGKIYAGILRILFWQTAITWRDRLVSSVPYSNKQQSHGQICLYHPGLILQNNNHMVRYAGILRILFCQTTNTYDAWGKQLRDFILALSKYTGTDADTHTQPQWLWQVLVQKKREKHPPTFCKNLKSCVFFFFFFYKWQKSGIFRSNLSFWNAPLLSLSSRTNTKRL